MRMLPRTGTFGVSFDDPADGFDRLEKVFAVANDVLHDGSESEKLPADHLLENVKLVIELGVAQTFLRNLADGVHHRRVVPAPEVFSDLGQAVLSELLREVHGDLARMRDVGRTTLGVHVGHLDLVVVGNRLLDVLDRDEVVDHGELIPKHALGHVDRDFAMCGGLELLVGDHLLQSAFEFDSGTL